MRKKSGASTNSLIGTSEASRILEVTSETIRRYANSGRLPVAVRSASNVCLFFPDEVHALKRELDADAKAG